MCTTNEKRNKQNVHGKGMITANKWWWKNKIVQREGVRRPHPPYLTYPYVYSIILHLNPNLIGTNLAAVAVAAAVVVAATAFVVFAVD